MFNKNRLEKWIGVSAKFTVGNSRSGILGALKYGVRLPIAPGTTPITECTLNFNEKISGEKPHYWFVNDRQAIKVRIFPLLSRVADDKITGWGYNKKLIKYTIIKM